VKAMVDGQASTTLTHPHPHRFRCFYLNFLRRLVRTILLRNLLKGANKKNTIDVKSTPLATRKRCVINDLSDLCHPFMLCVSVPYPLGFF
jgi:hypothetical protein